MFLRKPRFASQLTVVEDEDPVMVDETPSSQVDSYMNVTTTKASELHKVVSTEIY